jgi:hypothetical protein
VTARGRRMAFFWGFVLVSACSAATLPPGTPPPEYETRPVEPWPPASAVTAPSAETPLPSNDAPPAAPPPDPSVTEGPSDAGTAPSDAAADAAAP